jgi:transposase
MQLSEAQRRDIGSYAKKPHNISALACKYGVSTDSIRRWLVEGEKSCPNYADAPRSGRPTVLKASDKANIKRSGRRGLTAATITKNLNRHRPNPISQATVSRALAGGPNPMRWGPINRGKVLSKDNKEKRVDYCLLNQNRHFSKWVFVDAKFLYLYMSRNGYLHWAWQDVGKEQKVEPNTNPWVFCFYAAVALGHKSQLFFVPPTPARGTRAHKSKGSLVSEDVIAMLQELVPILQGWYRGKGTWHLVMDNASQHTSGDTQLALQQLGVKLVEGYPAQSWDLNIIENCWGMLDTKLLGSKARNTDAWFSAIEKAWSQVDQSSIDKLVGSLRGRMHKIIELEGAWIKAPKGSSRGR